MHPSDYSPRRIFILGLLAYLIILVGVATRNGLMLVLVLPIAVYLLMGLLAGPQKILLEVRRSLSGERTLPGEPVVMTLSVRNIGPALEEVLIEDPLPPAFNVINGSPRCLLPLASGETHTWTYTVAGGRGYYPLLMIRAVANDSLGIVVRETYVPTDGHLFILPHVTRLRRLTIRPRMTRVYSGLIPAREGGSGVEFFGIRGYEPGDSLRSINWRSAARHPEELYTKQFEQERVADIGLMLDARLRTNVIGERSILDHSVLATAALADTLLAAGNRVGLLVYGKYVYWTMPDYGKLQREKILLALARAEIGQSQAFSDLIIPRRLFPAYSQMVLISPVCSDDVAVIVRLRSAGFQVIVVSPDPIAFELEGLPRNKSMTLAARIMRLERAVILHRLQRAGVQVVNWDVSQPFEQVANATLTRPPAWVRAVSWEGQR
jgi:uncharacterized protein (DUF58 family)